MHGFHDDPIAEMTTLPDSKERSRVEVTGEHQRAQDTDHRRTA